jgi:micrococcal nuclease
MRTLIFLLSLLPALAAAKSYGSAVVDEVTSIYDGDTFRVTIRNWPAVVGERVPVRVLGIDAPELRGKCQQEKERARAAKQFTVAALRGAKRIELQQIERGKYFRLLARVSVDGRDLGEQLIERGLARPYDGGTRRGWCGQ